MNVDILDHIIALASPHRTVADILDLSLDIILRWLGQAAGGAYLVHGRTVQLVAQRGLDTRLISRQPLPLEQTAVAAGSHGAHVLPSSELGRFGLSQAPGEWHIESLVLLPLDQQRERGFLLLGAPDAMVLTNAKCRLLSTIGYAVGLAIQNTDLQSEAAAGASRGQAIMDMCRTLVSTSDLGGLLELVIYTAVQATDNATNGVIHFYDTEEKGLASELPEATEPRQTDTEESRLVTLGRRVAQQALDEEYVVHVPDMAQDDRFADMRLDSLHRSLLVAPLKTREHPMGMLIIESQIPCAFTQADERFVRSLATTAAEAIEHRRLAPRREALSKEWYRLLFSDSSRLLVGVAHDLRNPLTAVMGYTQLLQATEEAGSAAYHDLNKILSQAQKAAQVASNLGGFARQCGMLAARASLNDLLTQTLALWAHSLEAKNIHLDTALSSGDLKVEIDPPWLQQLFLRFICHVTDTLSCLPEGGHLHVATELDGAMACVRCTYGPSTSPSFLIGEEEIASRGMPTPGGLSLCAQIAEEYGGSTRYLDLGSETRSWIVELPLVRNVETAVNSDQSLRKRSST
jgi:uncharacterized protein YigA (DUF484 family)